MSPKIHHTMGGIATDTSTVSCQLLTTNRFPDFMQPVSVQAASTVRSELVQNAVMDCLVNGKLAGETVIKDAKK